ncbi:purine catabolism regulatory protein [Modestobacter sp. DSM 44400]|uniref:PucR family transcriptional regulator n=1 Tax=Modestobacter sp. DSM 44400 TaxID=1550230 RepID=UPI00089797D9|nr:PucR family transcriptional regulator [Modestobacter sp. DSM 44400]SDY05245.1 purine catabolism regulatory protein [Modestobacter sp. DSM 44400]
MPVTVSQLLDNPALALTLHTTAAPVDRPVSWVHVSELTDPTPFLEGGELLLTTGLALACGPQLAVYVRRLADAGVVGLGMGTGISHGTVPAELVAAADACGLAVLEVPREIPFIALSRAVSAALAAEEYAAVSRTSTALQELTRAALAPGAPATVVDRVARQVGGWALLMDAAGTPLEARPPAALGRAAGLAAEVDRLRVVRAPSSAALSRPGESVLLQSLGNGPRTRGFLAVGLPGPVPAADRHVVNAAALLLTLRLEQSRALDTATAALRAALLRMLLAGEEAVVAPAVEALGEHLPTGPLRVLAVLGSPEHRSAAVDVAADAAAHAREPLFSAELDDALVLLVTDAGELAQRLAVLPDRVPGVAVGISPAVPWAQLAAGTRQARQAAEQSRLGGSSVTHFADLAGLGLTPLLDPDRTRAFAEALLAPVVAADVAGGGQLIDSLRTWLAHHGQWEPAAVRLGVHRHTLRKRIRRVGNLLGRDLGSPGVRAGVRDCRRGNRTAATGGPAAVLIRPTRPAGRPPPVLHGTGGDRRRSAPQPARDDVSAAPPRALSTRPGPGSGAVGRPPRSHRPRERPRSCGPGGR